MQNEVLLMYELYEGVDAMSGLGAAIRQEEKIAISKNMLKSNLPIQTIIKYTGLSKEEIEKLK